MHLGEKLDPDLIHKEEYKGSPILSILLDNIFNLKIWLGSITGNLNILTFSEKILFLIWWMFFLSCLLALSNIIGVIIFLCIWIGAKSTSFHIITTIRELSDHVGLSINNILSFTRNGPNDSILKWIIYPHSNNWHLVHHLAPYIPHYNLKKAHEILKNSSEYLNCHHCDGVFFGAHPLVKCLNATCSN